MADVLNQLQRSTLMRAIKSRDTAPELAVRSLLHRMGFRFRLNRKDLPGKPDIVLPGRRTVIFVHGCFWHMHSCKTGHIPKSRIDYWKPKLLRTQVRDLENSQRLIEQGWKVLTVWECELADPNALALRLRQQLVSDLIN